MQFKTLLKIYQMDGTLPNINFAKILKNIQINYFNLSRKGNSFLLYFYTNDYTKITELKRRFGSKKNRKNTVVEQLEFSSIAKKGKGVDFNVSSH